MDPEDWFEDNVTKFHVVAAHSVGILVNIYIYI